MKLHKVDELQAPPCIGTRYQVPCIFYPEVYGKRAIPICGPQHEDSEIGFDSEHYHFDPRFLTIDEMCLLLSQSEMLPRIHCLDEAVPFEERILVTKIAHAVTTITEKPHYRVRECLREMPPFPLGEEENEIVPYLPKLEEAYEHMRLNYMHCPHKKFDLRSLPVHEGKVTCPGHGLQWDVATGRLVKRCAP